MTSVVCLLTCSSLTAWARAPYPGVDFRGVDIRYTLVDNAEACQQACNDEDKCQFYTYVKENFRDPAYRYSIYRAEPSLKQTNVASESLLHLCRRRRCYLKRSITIPSPPKIRKLQNVVSGFSLSLSP